MVDIATRVYNHTWKIDPIVRSVIDTDFYKLLMLQMIWGLYPKVEATFSLINRKKTVRLADEIDEEEEEEEEDVIVEHTDTNVKRLVRPLSTLSLPHMFKVLTSFLMRHQGRLCF